MLRNSFFASILFILVGVLLPTPDVLYVADLKLDSTYLYMVFCILAFLLANHAVKAVMPVYPEEPLESQTESDCIRLSALIILFLVALSGVVILIAQISATVGLPTYFALIFSASSQETSNLRAQTIFISASEGGYPGIIKMFHWDTVIGPFCLLAMLARGYRLRGRNSYLLVAGIACAFVAGTFLRQDRLSILSMIPVLISNASRLRKTSGGKVTKVAAVLAAILMVGAIVVQSNRRASDYGLQGWIALYTQLGTVNLALMMNSIFTHTYGFTGPFAAFSAVGKAFGLDLTAHGNLRYIWADVDNAFGYSYLDVGWFGIGYFLFLGGLSRYLDVRARAAELAKSPSTVREVQWIMAYAMLSVPFIPAYAGIEFWFMLLAAPILVKFLIARQRAEIHTGPPPREVSKLLMANFGK